MSCLQGVLGIVLCCQPQDGLVLSARQPDHRLLSERLIPMHISQEPRRLLSGEACIGAMHSVHHEGAKDPEKVECIAACLDLV